MVKILEWFSSTVLHDIIDFERVDNLEVFANYYKEENSLLSWNLVSAYLSSQPTLLCTCLLFAFIVLASTAALGVFCVARFVFGACGAKRYQVSHKNPTSVRCFVILLFVFLGLWIIMGLCSLFMILSASSLSGRFDFESEKAHIDHYFNGTETDRHVVINLDSVLIDETATTPIDLDEAQQLQRFIDIRELGYEFKPLERDSTHSWHAVILWLLASFYAFATLITGVLIVLGTYQYLISYHPMDRSTISNYCGLWAIHSAVGLFCVSPFVFLLSGIFLVYTHIHETICPLLQTLTQNRNMEDYINMHFDAFDTNNLVAFLNDLLGERMELNQQNCRDFISPIEQLWAGAFIMAFLSIPVVIALLMLSKYFLKMDSKYYWSQHETYSTIPDSKKIKSLPVEPVFVPKY